jgi:hypothetical protein
MKRIITTIAIAFVYIYTTKAQTIHNAWVGDTISYFQDKDHYLVKTTIMKDSLVSTVKNSQNTTVETYQKFVTRERVTIIPEELWKFTNLDFNTMIKQNNTLSTGGRYDKKPTFSPLVPPLYEKRYRYELNEFKVVIARSPVLIFVTLLLSILIIYMPFRAMNHLVEIYTKRHNGKPYWADLVAFWAYILLFAGSFVFSVYGTQGNVLSSVWGWLNLPNLIALIFCIVWIYRKVKEFKKIKRDKGHYSNIYMHI